MAHPNIVPNAKILLVEFMSGSTLAQVIYRVNGNGLMRRASASKEVATVLALECKLRDDPHFDLLLTDYDTLATFAEPGELDDQTAQEVLDYVG